MSHIDLYPTRTKYQECLIQRQEPAVYGDAKPGGFLSQEQLDFYDQNGYLVLEGLFHDKVQLILDEIEILKEQLKGREELILEPETDILRSVFSPEKYSAPCYELATSEPLLQSARQILNDDVYIHHSRINIKAAFDGKSFPWHSDFETWHAEDAIPRMRILTGWVFLTENNAFNGSLMVVPGSHKKFVGCVGETPENNYQQSLRKQTLGVPSKEMMQELVQEHGIEVLHGPPGTVVFHEGNLMHGSPDNMSPFARSNLFFVYNSVHNQPDLSLLSNQKARPDFLARQTVKPLKEQESFTAYTQV